MKKAEKRKTLGTPDSSRGIVTRWRQARRSEWPPMQDSAELNTYPPPPPGPAPGGVQRPP